MDKKQGKKKNSELVINSDQSRAVVANGDDLVVENVTYSQNDIEKLIITVRGEQVIIDQDVARLYGVSTKRLNEQVKRNIARFPASFRFELTKEEVSEVVANCDHLSFLKFRPTLPYAFTEQGIGQLSSVVHSQLMDKRANGVEAMIYSRYNEMFLTDLKKHNDQYPEINFTQLSHRNHDRFLIIDDVVYFLGVSVKDMGIGMCAVTKMQASAETILQLLN